MPRSVFILLISVLAAGVFITGWFFFARQESGMSFREGIRSTNRPPVSDYDIEGIILKSRCQTERAVLSSYSRETEIFVCEIDLQVLVVERPFLTAFLASLNRLVFHLKGIRFPREQRISENDVLTLTLESETPIQLISARKIRALVPNLLEGELRIFFARKFTVIK